MRRGIIDVVLAATLVACTTLTGPAWAQTDRQLSPEQMMGFMKVMLKGALEVYASPEMADAMATFYRNLYEALVKQGFSREEALQIVVSQGSVLTPTSQ